MDREPSDLLDWLDPGARDEGYWPRFHGRVMELTSAELTRRRTITSDLTVSGVVRAWGRVLVPISAAAAILAGALLLQQRTPPIAAPAGIEELLVVGLEEEPIPSILLAEEVPDAASMFAAVER